MNFSDIWENYTVSMQTRGGSKALLWQSKMMGLLSSWQAVGGVTLKIAVIPSVTSSSQDVCKYNGQRIMVWVNLDSLEYHQPKYKTNKNKDNKYRTSSNIFLHHVCFITLNRNGKPVRAFFIQVEPTILTPGSALGDRHCHSLFNF